MSLKTISLLLGDPAIKRAYQQRIGWDYQRWSYVVGQLHVDAQPTLDELEYAWATDGGVTRQAVAQAGSASPVALLVASMVWGFGTLPYGPARTTKMLRSPGVDEAAAAIVAAARSTPEEGFQSLFANRRPVIEGLNIAMGTKLLYFASPPRDDAPTPVVYDVVVHAALTALAPDLDSPNPRKFTTAVRYQQVCKWMADTARDAGAGIRADDVEYALFQYPTWARRRESLRIHGNQC